MKTITKKFGTRTISVSLAFCFLIGLFTFVPSLFPTLKAEAAMTNTQVVSGIDYSGQGTKITGDVRSAPATISGDRVNIPIWTYGSYVYSSWDKFWAGWSSWSPSNVKYNGYKGYRYAPESKHIIDFESKTEYQYRRWHSDWNPVYRTRYYTEYVKYTKILFINFPSYTTESSLGGYPGAKSGWTINKRYTESELSYYAGGYEYADWRDSAPFAWTGWPFYEPAWSAYNSRQTYRVKMCDSWWDSSWKNESSEQVPLNYSIYKTNGTALNYGAKWTYSSGLSSKKYLPGNITIVNRYMLNSDGIKQLLNGKEDALDRLILNQGSSWWEVAIGASIGIATLRANPYVGGAVLFAETLYAVMGEVVANNMKAKYSSIKEMLTLAQDYQINVVFEYYQTTTLTSSGGFSYYNMKEFATQRKYLSMKYQNNEQPSTGYFINDAYGMVTYLTSTKPVVDEIESYVKLKSLPQFM